MTSTILLIRHAAHSHLGRVLSGRMPALALTPDGRSQAEALAARLRHGELDLVHASPVQRVQETARSIAAARQGIQVETIPALDEIDFGDWTGRAFAELEDDPQWHVWNAQRATATTPGGETMAEAQARAWSHVERAAQRHPGKTIAMVSHCDIIRAIIMEALGLSLDHIHRFDIPAASVSRLEVGDWGARVLSINEASIIEESHG